MKLTFNQITTTIVLCAFTVPPSEVSAFATVGKGLRSQTSVAIAAATLSVPDDGAESFADTLRVVDSSAASTNGASLSIVDSSAASIKEAVKDPSMDLVEMQKRIETFSRTLEGVSDDDLSCQLESVVDLFSYSPIAKRMQTWPRGYPGDFETIEYLAQAINKAPSSGHLVEAFVLNTLMAQQHRNKVERQSKIMMDAIEAKRCANPTQADCQILSLACGGNLDVRKIQDEVGPEARFTLVDYDSGALAFSKEKLSGIANQCRFIEANVMKLPRGIIPMPEGKGRCSFDVVVAGGLFDYLSDRMITKIVSYIWTNMLAPGGTVFFTNVGPNYPLEPIMTHILNWKLLDRSELTMRRMCSDAGIPDEFVSCELDATGVTYLVEIRKPL